MIHEISTPSTLTPPDISQNPNIGALGTAEYQPFSNRIKGFCGRVVLCPEDYRTHHTMFVEPLMVINHPTRIIDRAIVIDTVDLSRTLQELGLHIEATIPLGGRWQGYNWVMMGTNLPGRQLSEVTEFLLMDIIRRASQQPYLPARSLVSGFTAEILTPSNLYTDEINQLARIFSMAFSHYITPVTDPDYLKRWVMDKSVLPMAVRDAQGHIVSIGSGELGKIDLDSKDGPREFKFFEIGDLASHPDYRNMGLNRLIAQQLIREAKMRGFDSVHAEARACWNVVNYSCAKNGMTFRGLLPLNTVIRGPETVAETEGPEVAVDAKNYGSLAVWSLTPADAVWENY